MNNTQVWLARYSFIVVPDRGMVREMLHPADDEEILMRVNFRDSHIMTTNYVFRRR